ncbi:MFS transporter [Haloimpatiens sp. FM7330]|uniref:MFS transporter n=1 Tax=Haloimpatiens sp. FM7330 TaxID=3298610 RepID=UPI0036377891
MKKNAKFMNLTAIIFIFLIMFTMAIIDNLKGAFVPTYKNVFHVTDVNIGLMITSASIGYIICTYIGGYLSGKIGQKKVIILGLLSMIFGLIVLSKAISFTMVIMGTILCSSGVSLISIGINTIVPVLFISFQAILMNLTHFCYGLGSATGQRFVGVMIFKGFNWRNIFLIIAALTAVVMITFIFIKIPGVHKEEEVSKIGMKDILSNKLICFFILALGFYMGAEWCTGNWFMNYTNKVFKLDQGTCSYYSAAFFTIFAVGRLLGGFIVEKFDYLKAVKFSLLGAIITYTIGISIGEKGVTLIAISGLFFAIVFPTTVVVISNQFKKSTAYITGIIITIASLLSTLINFLMGYLNDIIGVQNTYYIVPICLVVSLAFITIIHYTIKPKSTQETSFDAEIA